MVRRAFLLVAILLVGCSDDGGGDSSNSFTTSVCESVETWMNDMVDATNQFTDDSGELSVAARRTRYLETFDDLAGITDTLHDRLAAQAATGVEADIRTTLIEATDTVQQQINANRAAARALPDDRYESVSVAGGPLFSGTEKAMSTVLKALNEQANTHGIEALTGTCGRR